MLKNSKEEKASNIGKIITFGSLNLFLTLRLEREDIKASGLYTFNQIQSLEDIFFITENYKLWERIELTSNNDLINSLFRMNLIKKTKNIISYIVLDKLDFNEDQTKFKKLLDYVLLENGLIMQNYEICNCHISINLRLFYQKKMKKFVLYGQEDYDEDEIEENQEEQKNENDEEEKEKENKSDDDKEEQKNSNDISQNNEESKQKDEENEEEENNDINDIGNFEKIPNEEVKFEDFKYLYIHYKDFMKGGDLCNGFKLYQLYNFLKKMKENSKLKIIFNFGDNFDKNEKYLIKFIKLSDIHIFRDKNILYSIIKKRAQKEEIQREKENQKIIELLRTQKSPKMKKIKKLNTKDSKNSSFSNIKNNSLYFSKRDRFNQSNQNTSFTKFSKTLNKSQSVGNITISKGLNQSFEPFNKGSLDKNNMYQYLRELIYSFSFKEKHPNYNDKLGIYLDEYKKIYIVNYKISVFYPKLTEYDLNIYPKSNVYNLKEINKIKDLLTKDNDKYTNILYGCILSTIVDETDNYFMFYYYCKLSVLKLLALKKNNIPIPKDKSFYLIKVDKSKLNKMQNEENEKKKENGFNNNHFQRKYKGNDCQYYPLMDQFLTSYMQSMVNIDILKNKNLINDKKKILYDPEYKDIYKLENYYPKDLNNRKFAKFIMKQNLIKNFDAKEKDYKKEYLSKKPEMKYHIPGINGVPEYIVYLSKEERKKLLKNKLPPLKPKKKPKKEEKVKEVILFRKNFHENTEKKENTLRDAKNDLDEVKEDEKNEKEEKINTDGYKEIKFQDTQLEANNL